MGYSKTPTIKTFLYCTECDNLTIIWRIVGRQKKEGHLKNLYCYKCRMVTQHQEAKEHCEFELPDEGSLDKSLNP
jgi:ribosomal protein L33